MIYYDTKPILRYIYYDTKPILRYIYYDTKPILRYIYITVQCLPNTNRRLGDFERLENCLSNEKQRNFGNYFYHQKAVKTNVNHTYVNDKGVFRTQLNF